MRLIFLSGLSGSGKSVALHMLEDLDFYCIDNIPAALLQTFISHTVRSGLRCISAPRLASTPAIRMPISPPCRC